MHIHSYCRLVSTLAVSGCESLSTDEAVLVITLIKLAILGFLGGYRQPLLS